MNWVLSLVNNVHCMCWRVFDMLLGNFWDRFFMGLGVWTSHGLVCWCLGSPIDHPELDLVVSDHSIVLYAFVIISLWSAVIPIFFIGIGCKKHLYSGYVTGSFLQADFVSPYSFWLDCSGWSILALDSAKFYIFAQLITLQANRPLGSFALHTFKLNWKIWLDFLFFRFAYFRLPWYYQFFPVIGKERFTADRILLYMWSVGGDGLQYHLAP